MKRTLNWPPNASHSSKSSSSAAAQRCSLGFTSAFTTTTTDIKCTTTLAAAVAAAAVTASALRKLRQVSHQLQSFECKMHPFFSSVCLSFSKLGRGNYLGTFAEGKTALFIYQRFRFFCAGQMSTFQFGSPLKF